MDEQSIPFITLPNWVKAASRCGFNIEPVFDRLGIPTDLVHLESATISRHQLEQAMEACIARARHRHFPLVLGETFAFDYLPDLETFVMTSPTLREAAKVFDWVQTLINPMISLRLEETGVQAALVLTWDGGTGGAPKPWFGETIFAAVVKFGRMLLREHGDFRGLSFIHPLPAYASQYSESFQLPVRCGAERNALEFNRALLDRQLPGAYPSLHRQAALRVQQYLQRFTRPTPLIGAIEAALERDPGLLGEGLPALAGVLGIHRRTLQRRLRQEGHNFGNVRDRVRYRLALRYLEEGRDDLETISDRLGFSDRRSFTRAFTRWSGLSPSAFRTGSGRREDGTLHRQG